MNPGADILRTENHEKYAQAVASGLGETRAYMRVYEQADRKAAMRAVYRIRKNDAITARIKFLRLTRSSKLNSDGVDLRSAIMTCKEVLETSDSSPQKMKAIEVLNKLGVFDGESKRDGKRMDPGAVCEYLATYAGKSVKELALVPGGIKGLLVRLIDLTGVGVGGIQTALDEIGATAANSATDLLSKNLVPSPPLPAAEPGAAESGDDNDDPDDEGDETLTETVTAPPSEAEEEISESMAQRLAPALAHCEKLENQQGKPIEF